jgi:Peroxidase, family 2
VLDLTFGLMAGYNLSFPLAIFLSVGGFFLLQRIRSVSLYDIGKHGAVEHDASLVHRDTPPNEKYAPIEIEQELVKELINDAKTGNEDGEGPEAGDRRILMDACDVARARVRREKCSPALDGLHAEIARGEMAIILGVWETKAGSNVGVPVEWMREWMGHERLPRDWKATHVQGLFDVIKRSKAIRSSMEQQKKEQSQAVITANEKWNWKL